MSRATQIEMNDEPIMQQQDLVALIEKAVAPELLQQILDAARLCKREEEQFAYFTCATGTGGDLLKYA